VRRPLASADAGRSGAENRVRRLLVSADAGRAVRDAPERPGVHSPGTAEVLGEGRTSSPSISLATLYAAGVEIAMRCDGA